MRLRVILMVLSLLAFLSASTGGYLYYASLKEAALKEAERQSISRVDSIKKNLSSFLSENIKPVRILAGNQALAEALQTPGPDSLAGANRVLDYYRDALNVAVCYLMKADGTTIATSNRTDPDSFVGNNFSFRPYFQQAISGHPSTYLALGAASYKRGAYYSCPVYGRSGKKPIGVAVIKASIEQIEKELALSEEEYVFVTDPRGIIFITNKSDWLYYFLWKVEAQKINQIALSRQFGTGVGIWTGMEQRGAHHAVDPSGNQYLMQQASLDRYPGWKIVRLRSMKAISRSVSDPLFRVAGAVILSLCVLVGFSVFILYRMASQEIRRRKTIQAALQESEERYRYLYQKTPAFLHSIDKEGRLVNASDHWVEKLGYGSRKSVLGRKLTEFFTEASRQYAEDIVFPAFFKTGQCKDVPYQYVCKNGEVIDILLSAISIQDNHPDSMRSLAVSIDVTERNRAVAALQEAKEALSRHSKELERQVNSRTREITSILKYTPDVVSIKDTKGRYILINARFENLIGLVNAEVQGKTDYDIFPARIADQFKENDQKVIQNGVPLQVEEVMPHRDGIEHTYLSVKFPIYDELGTTNAICEISTDITELKKTQIQLRRLSAGIMNSQEKERSAIARELHDELGQVLTALRMDSVWLIERIRTIDEKAAERALTMRNLIDKTIKDVRSMAFRLRPGVLDDLGLVEALELYTTDFEKRTGITCVFEHRDIPAVGDTVATAAYRITQEALTNVVRHAEAGYTEVGLFLENRFLRLTVRDDGKGFDPESAEPTDGLGLAGMRERAGLAAGSLLVESRQGAGTSVIFRVSIQNIYPG